MDVSFHHADRGATRPTEIPALGRRGDAQIAVDHEVAAGGLREVETNLQGLTMGIPPLKREDVPLHLQRHTVGVPESINSLLRRVARAVMCYLEHNVMQED
jgi:hypothetical protein